MGDPRITYNSINVDLEDLSVYRPAPAATNAAVIRADSGVSETSILEVYDRVYIEIENFDDRDILHDLTAWWAWAKQGQSYSFAFDSAKTVDTTLSAGAWFCPSACSWAPG